jgi:hypothetical protein
MLLQRVFHLKKAAEMLFSREAFKTSGEKTGKTCIAAWAVWMTFLPSQGCERTVILT